MSLQWYVVHAYSGFEEKAKQALEERIVSLGKQDSFGEILVPSESVVEMKKGVRKTGVRKFFPGYMLVEMDLNDETWHIVRSIPKITGFVGNSLRPTPLSDSEVDKIKNDQSSRPKPKVSYEKGEQVRVVDGAFANFNGVVEEVSAEKSRLRVLVSIFGRSTPIELSFEQVERVS